MSEQIKISDGFKTYDIVNQDGKLLGQFSFNPSDVNIVHRHAEVVKSLQNISQEMETKKEELGLEEAISAIDAVVYDKINYLLNSDAAKDFFSIMGPFTPLEDGQYFIQTVLDAIGQVIQSETEKRAKKAQNKIKKYTSKYHN